MNKATVFSDDMFHGFAGAARFPQTTFDEQTTRPVSREIGDYLIIACGQQTGCYGDANPEDDCGIPMWGLKGVVFPNQKAAIAWLNCLPEDFTPQAFGFESF